MTRTFEQWKDLVAGSVRVRDNRDIELIAEMCQAADGQPDMNSGTWHNAALFYGTQCHCVPCSKARSA